MYANHKICSECGGTCCQRMPGLMSPEDVRRMFPAETLGQSLMLCLSNGKFVIDWWEGDPRGLDYDDPDYISTVEFIRPRAISDRPRLHNRAWGIHDTCIFFSMVDGCSLEEDNRPLQCKMLEPGEKDCIMHEGGRKRDIAIMWIPHADLIESVCDAIEDRE